MILNNTSDPLVDDAGVDVHFLFPKVALIGYEECRFYCIVHSNPYTELRIFPSQKTLKNELKKLRYEKMVENELNLTNRIDEKTKLLEQARQGLEEDSKTLEHKVAERTVELLKTNERLQNEIKIRKEAEAQKETVILSLQKTIKAVKELKGLLPICAKCKKIRDDKGYWNQIESYIAQHTDAEFSHGICPECIEKLYGDENWYKKKT